MLTEQDYKPCTVPTLGNNCTRSMWPTDYLQAPWCSLTCWLLLLLLLLLPDSMLEGAQEDRKPLLWPD